ncbi:hypothetical protein Tco_1223598 [Tanacetum coccineum]
MGGRSKQICDSLVTDKASLNQFSDRLVTEKVLLIAGELKVKSNDSNAASSILCAAIEDYYCQGILNIVVEC